MFFCQHFIAKGSKTFGSTVDGQQTLLLRSYFSLPQITQIEKIFYHFFTFGSKTVGSDLTIFIKILFSLGITQINLVFALTYNKIRCLTSSKALSGFPQMLRCFSTCRLIGHSTLCPYCWLYSVICHLVFLYKNIMIAISINIRATICHRAVVSFALVVGSAITIVSERMWVV